MPKRSTRLEGVKCGGCGRYLTTQYLSSGPGPETPPEMIHDRSRPDRPSATFFCTCAHYTIIERP